MERYKYRAINQNGRGVSGVISAANEIDLYNQLQSAGLELVDCRPLSEKKMISLSFFAKKVQIRELVQLFIQLGQLQGAGVPMLDSLSDVRDSCDNPTLRDVMSDVSRDVTDGSSLSEAMAKHPKVFTKLYVALISAGEHTGDLTSIYGQLVDYLKWVDYMQAKIKKATRYPMIVMAVVVLMLVVMLGYVVPQVIGFISTLGQEIPIYTKALIATSDFFRNNIGGLFGVPIVVFIAVKILRKMSSGFAYRFDLMLLSLPILGNIIRKITTARYAQTFGVLYSSGIDVVSALVSARATVTNMAMLEALEAVEGYVKAGSSLSEAFEACGEFPMLVIRMLKIGEDSGGLAHILEQITEFYTRDVNEAVDGLVSIIEPALTAVMGGMILWIALAVFGPIYSSFEDIGI